MAHEAENSAEVAKQVSLKHAAMLAQAAQEATYVFTAPVVVTPEDRLHGLGGIIEKKLLKAGIVSASTPAQKKNYMIDFLEKKLGGLGPEELKKLGFEKGTASIIRAGEILDLSVLDKNGWVQAIR